MYVILQTTNTMTTEKEVQLARFAKALGHPTRLIINFLTEIKKDN